MGTTLSPAVLSGRSSTPSPISSPPSPKPPATVLPRPSPVVPSKPLEWSGPDDPDDPRNLPGWRRWAAVVVLSACSFCVTCTSSLYASTIVHLEPAFGVSRIVATLGLSMFVFGLGLSPMLLAPLSERFGRRPIYLGSFTFFVIWLVPCALARNIATMMISRFIDGLAGGAFLSVVGGSVSDMFPRDKLGGPVMIITAGPFLGPVFGPLIGGFVNIDPSRWRWSFWLLTIWAAVLLVALIVFAPETHHPVILRRRARRTDLIPVQPIVWSELAADIAVSCRRPFQMLTFEPMCACLSLLLAVLLGIIYLFFGSFPVVFARTYGFRTEQTGVAFLGLMIGMLIGISSDPIWKRIYARLVAANGGVAEPEFRLPATIAGAVLVPIGLFGFGWTMNPSIHWIVPIVFSGIFGLGNILCFSGVYTFLVQCYPAYAASAMAANGFFRSSFAAAFPLFGVQLYTRVGTHWATSILAFLGLALSPFPYVFYRYGKTLRRHSRFAIQPGQTESKIGS